MNKEEANELIAKIKAIELEPLESLGGTDDEWKDGFCAAIEMVIKTIRGEKKIDYHSRWL